MSQCIAVNAGRRRQPVQTVTGGQTDQEQCCQRQSRNMFAQSEFLPIQFLLVQQVRLSLEGQVPYFRSRNAYDKLAILGVLLRG